MIDFPKNFFDDSATYFEEYSNELRRAASLIDKKIYINAVEEIEKTIIRGGTIYTMGNGGSASISGHLLCDYVKGIYTDTSLKPKVLLIPVPKHFDTASLTANRAAKCFAGSPCD